MGPIGAGIGGYIGGRRPDYDFQKQGNPLVPATVYPFLLTLGDGRKFTVEIRVEDRTGTWSFGGDHNAAKAAHTREQWLELQAEMWDSIRSQQQRARKPEGSRDDNPRRKQKRRTNVATKIDDDDIRDAIETELDRKANQSAAEGRSYLDDQTMIDLDEEGYDDQSALYMAWFGDEFAVDSDILVGPHWYDLLDLKKPKHGAQTWSEAGTKDDRRADFALIDWAKKNGYERVDRFGGDWPGGIEAEIQVNFVVDAVHEKTKAPEKRILRVMRKEFGKSGRFEDKPPYGQIYWSSSDGEIEMYAKRRAGEDEEDEDSRDDNPRHARLARSLSR